MNMATAAPDFDIMIPFYGDVSHLKLAVNSVLSQTFSNWRLSVVDDGYPDMSVGSWIRSLNDSRIRYLRNEINLGANGNYRKCVELAEADLIVMMGADDVMLPNYLDVIRNAHDGFPKASIFQPSVEVIDQDSLKLKPLADRIKKLLSPHIHQLVAFNGENFAASLMRGNWTYFPAICWTKSALKSVSFRNGLDVTQDLALLIDLAKSGHTFVYAPEIAFQYRRHTQSDSSVRAFDGSRFIEEKQIFEIFANEFEQLDWQKAEKAARRHVMSRLNTLAFAAKALRQLNFKSCVKLVRISLT